MRILIIEDSKDLAALLTLKLEGMGHEVRCLYSKESVDEKIILLFDFILSEFEGDGDHFYETKELAHFCGKPLLLMSSREFDSVHEHYIDKCDLGSQLESKIKEVMNEFV